MNTGHVGINVTNLERSRDFYSAVFGLQAAGGSDEVPRRFAFLEERLKARGATFAYDGIVPHREGAPSGGIFFEDPDGTRLEIFTRDGVEGDAPHHDAPSCGFF